MGGKRGERCHIDWCQRAITLATLIYFGWLATISSSAPFPTIEDKRPEVVLFCWHYAGNYRFALIPANQRAKFVRQFSPSNDSIRSMSDLKKALLHVPRDSVIAWRDDLRRNIVFPPADVVDRVKVFAVGHGIDLQIIPSIYD